MLSRQAFEVPKAQINAAGLVLGAQVPIILTSRADPPEARLASLALAMMV